MVDTGQVREDSGQGGHQSGGTGQWTGWTPVRSDRTVDRVGC